jgi:2-oxoglutarate ferredoxin oxidoreductase subunit alpha
LKKTDFVVRFAGEGGQGFLSAAVGFASANTRAGYHAQTFATFPSQITGGPTWMQARISTSPVLSRGDDLDVLVVFSEDAYNTHKDDVKDKGLILYDSDKLQLEDGDRSLGIPFDKLGRATGNPRAANMVMMGALAQLVGMPQDILEDFVKSRWGNTDRYGDQIVPQNIQALMLGRSAFESNITLGDLEPPIKPDYEQIFVNGNEAIALGAVASGLQFYVGYPISPATSILIWMEENLVGKGRFAYQVSSEIEAITAVIGASYSGVKAMSATAGPGFSLMGEGLGLAWMAEIPLVIADVQRGGPATGLPTKTEQSDLLSALNPAHGDVQMPVIAPGTVEECFYATVAAFNWAERYQGPVILLSEHSLSERQQNIPKPNLSELGVEDRDVYSGEDGYHRYEPSDLSPMPLPGRPGSYVANGSEHDGMGDTTHLPNRHIQMTERRFGKLKLLDDGTYESEGVESSVALMPWGASKGSAKEAYLRLIEVGEDLAWYYTMYLSPLPPRMLSELRQKELVLVPELNYLGQFSGVLRSQGVRAESITQYTGLPFKVSDLVTRISDRLASGRKRNTDI